MQRAVKEVIDLFYTCNVVFTHILIEASASTLHAGEGRAKLKVR